MPAVKIKPRSTQRKLSSDTNEETVSQSTTVLIIVEGESLEVYTGKEAVDKLSE